MKKLSLIFFAPLKYVHLKKDVGLFPVYFKQQYFDKVELLCFEKDNDVPGYYRGIEIKVISNKKFPAISSRIKEIKQNLQKNNYFIDYIKENKDITHVMMFHATLEHLLLSRRIKKILPSVKTYIKFDSDIDSCKYFISEHNKLFKFIRKNCLPFVDLLSIESELALEILKNKRELADKIFYVPNGYDNKLLREVDFNKKKKQIITVGRLGTYQKNTELLLDIISYINLKDWTVKLVGPIETGFTSYIDEFYNKNPQLREKVFFTGNISDEKKMIEVYAESSVFILTSRFEGSALVLTESAINGDYILSTDVGAIRQISSEKKFCFIAPESRQKEQDYEKLKEAFISKLQRIIDGDNCFDKIEEQVKYCRENFLMSNIVQLQCFKEWTVLYNGSQ